jgi:hypothetical protein
MKGLFGFLGAGLEIPGTWAGYWNGEFMQLGVSHQISESEYSRPWTKAVDVIHKHVLELMNNCTCGHVYRAGTEDCLSFRENYYQGIIDSQSTASDYIFLDVIMGIAIIALLARTISLCFRARNISRTLPR